MWQVRYASVMAGQCCLTRHETTAARVAKVASMVRACCHHFGRLLYATAYYLGTRWQQHELQVAPAAEAHDDK